MATLAPAARSGEPTIRTSHADRGMLFVAYAWICLGVAVLGFAPSFWYPMGTASFNGKWLVVAHGVLFTAWPILFLVQTLLVERGAIMRHKAWGVAGVSLATMILLLGIATVEAQLTDRLAAGYGNRARSFSITPLTNIALFFGFFAAAVANVGRPDWHKRLMMIASAIVLLPAFARMIFILVDGRPIGPLPAITPPGAPELGLRPGALVMLLLVGTAIADRMRRGAVHPAWWWGIGTFGTVALARVLLARTEGWYAVTDALVAFG